MKKVGKQINPKTFTYNKVFKLLHLAKTKNNKLLKNLHLEVI